MIIYEPSTLFLGPEKSIEHPVHSDRNLDISDMDSCTLQASIEVRFGSCMQYMQIWHRLGDQSDPSYLKPCEQCLKKTLLVV